MPLSAEFLNAFEEFVNNYQATGGSSILGSFGWKKQQNHSGICDYLRGILKTCKKNKGSFHDTSIIESLTIPINLSAKTNPYLLSCWNDFLSTYNTAKLAYTPISAMNTHSPVHIKIAPEGKSSEPIIRDLRKALDSTQQAQKYAQVAYDLELESLKRQNAELKKENLQLAAENHDLRERILNEQTFRELQPQIITARRELASFADLLGLIHDLIQAKPESLEHRAHTHDSEITNETPPVLQAPPVQLDRQDQESELKQPNSSKAEPSPQICDMPASSSEHETQPALVEPQVPNSEDTSLAILRMPPPPPSLTSSTPPKPGRIFNGEGFFKELQAELAKRNNPIKNASAASSSPVSHEKKSIPMLP
ncbi:hypothetical protein [Legionella worsleiensis]|uniref:VipA n=1 Tax=Legionella worsleiensis TaxID=45076 RepID=A0A0W1AK12_9GAMM|nr:hypothetical protein [Legionella worsleiensis]KTD81671.1 VipA [Legionella worsleiensis]STY31919.1 VipA [Legionella worsleiensis]